MINPCSCLKYIKIFNGRMAMVPTDSTGSGKVYLAKTKTKKYTAVAWYVTEAVVYTRQLLGASQRLMSLI